MANDQNSELEQLNALIDGELPPAKHAALAARIAAGRDLAHAHATFARLKACLVESAGDAAAVRLPAPRKSFGRKAAGLAALAATVALLVAGYWLVDRPAGTAMPVAERDDVIIRAALPAMPVIPDLGKAGLSLIELAVERPAGAAVLVASYRGPRGCRLELRVRPADAIVPPTEGTIRDAWSSGELAYELTAFGMPAARFALVLEAAKAATRPGHAPEIMEGRLREARIDAAPCIG